MILRLVCVAAVVIAACSHALAAEKMMTIDFVGDWCYDGQDDNDKNISWYKLPSWSRDGQCTKILSINKYGFYDNDRRCEPMKVKLEKSVAPSGTGYIAMITAQCRRNDPALDFRGPGVRNLPPSETQTFEFYRYKGTLKVTLK
jgi:hypothetical protein